VEVALVERSLNEFSDVAWRCTDVDGLVGTNLPGPRGRAVQFISHRRPGRGSICVRFSTLLGVINRTREYGFDVEMPGTKRSPERLKPGDVADPPRGKLMSALGVRLVERRVPVSRRLNTPGDRPCSRSVVKSTLVVESCPPIAPRISVLCCLRKLRPELELVALRERT